jgi:antitoxin CptB
MSDHDRIRWRCRRGMLELDLVLNAFLESHLAILEPHELEAFRALLERPDPELLDFVMGHAQPGAAEECQVIARLRDVNVHLASNIASAPVRLSTGEAGFVGASGVMPLAQN